MSASGSVPVRVVDSWALLAFFEGQPAAEAVETLLNEADEGGCRLLLSVVNWTEVYYVVARRTSRDIAEEKAREIAAMPVEVIPVDTFALARQAALLKAAHAVSLADAFAAALAMRENAEVVTGDPDFRLLEAEVRVRWL